MFSRALQPYLTCRFRSAGLVRRAHQTDPLQERDDALLRGRGHALARGRLLVVAVDEGLDLAVLALQLAELLLFLLVCGQKLYG